ncbi:unnamed protein product [Pleuronectes platessa]|uniref:Uncharacterized protein n=1 Tax=Pleuronectes platessa TaxID=8262 RepID=A0A9N7YX00_PLEPL|nr:unnamed protein product [Pleuronectes platessa]
MFIFVVKPLGTCRDWGSSHPVALLSAPPEAQCAARLEVFGGGAPCPVAPMPMLVRGLSFSWAVGGDQGTAVGSGNCGRVSGLSRGSPQLRRPLGEPSVRTVSPLG